MEYTSEQIARIIIEKASRNIPLPDINRALESLPDSITNCKRIVELTKIETPSNPNVADEIFVLCKAICEIYAMEKTQKEYVSSVTRQLTNKIVYHR